jgi:hypothetical protein
LEPVKIDAGDVLDQLHDLGELRSVVGLMDLEKNCLLKFSFLSLSSGLMAGETRLLVRPRQ